MGVTGSIAAYKTPYLIRLLITAGAEVRVVMTPSAERFITPLSFEALTHSKVLTEASENWADECNHIGYAKWAELMIIAPATANTITKLANGIADNLLLECALASKTTKLIAPAANSAMINNPLVVKATEALKQCGFSVINSDIGYLA